MSETYNDRHDSKIYGARLIIYRRGDVENASFTFRAKVAGQKGYIRRNTKTDDPARAMVLAEQAYEELQVRKKSGLSLIQLSANAFFDEWVEKQKTKLTATRWNWKRNCWDRYISSYLGHHNLAELTKKFVDGYWDHRTKFWTTAEGQKRILLNDKRVGAKTKSSHNVAVKPSYATLRMEAGLINEVLQGAVDSGHLSRTIRISAQDAVGKSERGDGSRATSNISAITKNETFHLFTCLARSMNPVIRCPQNSIADIPCRYHFDNMRLSHLLARERYWAGRSNLIFCSMPLKYSVFAAI